MAFGSTTYVAEGLRVGPRVRHAAHAAVGREPNAQILRDAAAQAGRRQSRLGDQSGEGSSRHCDALRPHLEASVCCVHSSVHQPSRHAWNMGRRRPERQLGHESVKPIIYPNTYIFCPFASKHQTLSRQSRSQDCMERVVVSTEHVLRS